MDEERIRYLEERLRKSKMKADLWMMATSAAIGVIAALVL
jgi:hypothetical protein